MKLRREGTLHARWRERKEEQMVELCATSAGKKVTSLLIVPRSRVEVASGSKKKWLIEFHYIVPILLLFVYLSVEKNFRCKAKYY